jgi:hypothetical protein
MSDPPAFEPDHRFARVPYVAPCRLRAGEEVRTARICNLSALGLYVQIEPVPSGEIELAFQLPDGGPPVEAGATVTWVNAAAPDDADALPPGCGLRFVAMAPGDRLRLRRAVRDFQARSGPADDPAQQRSDHVRVPWVSPCILAGAFGFARGTTCNLSTLGVFVAVEPVPGLGETVAVSLALPRRRLPFVSDAVVTWQNFEPPDHPRALPTGCGLRFEGLPADDRLLLAGLVSATLAGSAAGA